MLGFFLCPFETEESERGRGRIFFKNLCCAFTFLMVKGTYHYHSHLGYLYLLLKCEWLADKWFIIYHLTIYHFWLVAPWTATTRSWLWPTWVVVIRCCQSCRSIYNVVILVHERFGSNIPDGIVDHFLCLASDSPVCSYLPPY